ncbi:uncharacterized protein B0H18DRAFT_990276 [Fomitopsis serialis]|uniref:uncharacterized protein n=1 Tax=Fomitopsis serialis TaxID=139415 RepID=UPI0020086898|nr:uncharacterized protein B0H18DRAFT_990276 [Neoantrodia serialis]KAH9931216.1 hypothetical protein B0H18DRAFT_990276 [Neoantrodia serialis]
MASRGEMRSTTPLLSPPSSLVRSPPRHQQRHHTRPRAQTFPAARETRPGPPALPINSPSAEELARALELQFYRTELREQRRLMGVMEHHSM